MGKPYDFNTRLSNYGFRDYAAHTGRFTTVDPIRDGRNWYVYCNNDPVNWVDAWGLSACDVRKDPFFYVVGCEIISLGGLIASAGGFAFKETVIAIAAGTATPGTIIAGTLATGGCIVVGGAIILLGIDLLTGDGFDKTEEVINTIFGGGKN